MKKKIDKKAITPLMGAFLLVSFAIAVGVIVLNFGRAEVEEQAQCSLKIDLHFIEIGGKQDLCFDGTSLKFTVENGINANLGGLVVNIIGTQKAQKTEVNAALSRAETYVGVVPFDTTVNGQIRQVRIIPKVTLSQTEEICTEQTLVAENIPPC